MTLNNLKYALILNDKMLIQRLKERLHSHDNLSTLNGLAVDDTGKLTFNGNVITEQDILTDEEIKTMVEQVIAELGLEGSEPSTPESPSAPTSLSPEEVYKNTRPSDWLPMLKPEDNEMYLLFHVPNGVSSLLAFTVTCTGNYNVKLGTVYNGKFTAVSNRDVASGSKYEAEIFADDYENLTSTGMKQVMIKISGTDILTWEPSVHSKKSSPTDFARWNIVEISCKLPKANKIQCGKVENNDSKNLDKLRYFSSYGANMITNAHFMFHSCVSLITILQLDTSLVTDMEGMFYYCRSLVAIPQLNTSNVTNMCDTFDYCVSLTAIPQLDTSKVTNMQNMFSTCCALASIPQLDTSSVLSMQNMFQNCYALTTIPKLNTSKVTNMHSMFSQCYSLIMIPELDTSSVTGMGSMFSGCYALTTIPKLDTSSVISMYGMFQNCMSLSTIPELDTSKATNMSQMFWNCPSLTIISKLDTSSVASEDGMFLGCESLSSILLNGLIVHKTGVVLDLTNCSLSYTAIIALINSLPTLTSQCASSIKLIGNPGISELTSADKAIATNKYWTLILS